MTFLDLWKMNYCESIYQGCFEQSRTKGKRSKIIRYHSCLNHKLCWLGIGSCPVPLSALWKQWISLDWDHFLDQFALIAYITWYIPTIAPNNWIDQIWLKFIACFFILSWQWEHVWTLLFRGKWNHNKILIG